MPLRSGVDTVAPTATAVTATATVATVKGAFARTSFTFIVVVAFDGKGPRGDWVWGLCVAGWLVAGLQNGSWSSETTSGNN